MKKTQRLLVFAFLMMSCFVSVFSQDEKRIEAIRRIVKETEQKIAECETDGDVSTTFLTEMTVNKNNGPYPAVGLYQTVIKFYYTFGDREKNPYPDRLLKIIVLTKRSAATETTEFLFDERGSLIFYFDKKDDERRIYFAWERPFKILQGEKKMPINDRAAQELLKVIRAEKKKLHGLFLDSLSF